MSAANLIFFGHSAITAYRVNVSFEFDHLLPEYFYFAAAISIISLILVGLTASLSMRLVVCICIICLMPIASQEYKLIYIIIPMLMLLKSRKKSFPNHLMLGCMTLLMIPKGYYWPQGHHYYTSSHITADFLLLALLFLTVLISSSCFLIRRKKAGLNLSISSKIIR
jgi:hypothetical protein